MHLKNFSLIKDPRLGWKLSAAYDLLCTRLVIPKEKDPDELALALEGKKRIFTKNIFSNFGKHIGLNAKQIENVLKKYSGNFSQFVSIIEQSFLSESMKDTYKTLLENRFSKLFG